MTGVWLGAGAGAGVCIGVCGGVTNGAGACVGVEAGTNVGVWVGGDTEVGVTLAGAGAVADGLGVEGYAVPLAALMSLHASLRLSSSLLITTPSPTVQFVSSKFLLPMMVVTTFWHAADLHTWLISAGLEPPLTLARSTLPESAALKLFCLTHSTSSALTSRPLNATTSTSLAHAAARAAVGASVASSSSSRRVIELCVVRSRQRLLASRARARRWRLK